MGWNAARMCLLAVLCAACAASSEREAPGTRDVGFFLTRLHDLSRLPRLEPSRTALASTWDRSGDNFDGWDFKQLDDAANVLLDVEGPGCIHRLFAGRANEEVEGTRIQIFLDHEDAPRFDMLLEDFYAAERSPFPEPLLHTGAYPGLLMPIPFSRHARVQLVSALAEPNWGGYYQIAYTRFAADAAVDSLRWPLDDAQAHELERVVRRWDAALTPPPEPETWTLQEQGALPPAESLSLELSGCGIISRMEVRVEPRTPEAMRGLRLQLSWDGLADPSIDVPVGYFFGHGDQDPVDTGTQFSSLLMGLDGNWARSELPMPFADGAELKLHNAGPDALPSVALRIGHEGCTQLPEDTGRLHARWHQRPAATPDAPTFGPLEVPGHVLLEAEGPGKYVGAILHLDWPHEDWWGEGDVMIWTDEEGWPPGYHGTGTEEYFNGGFKVFDRTAVSGYIKTRPGPIALYSFHLGDAFHFQQSIRVAVETVGLFEGAAIVERDNPAWGTTAFWYALPARAVPGEGL